MRGIRPAGLVVLAGAVGMLGWGTVLPYQYAYAASSRGWGTIAAAAASTLFSVGALFAAPLGGRLADRVSPVRVAVVAKVVAAAATVGMLAASTPVAFLAAMFVFGAGITAAQPAQAVLILRWVGSRDRRKVFAWQFTASSVGMAVGALLAAQLVNLSRPTGMTSAFLLAGAGFVVSAVLVALAGVVAPREIQVDARLEGDVVPVDAGAVTSGSVLATVRLLWAVPGIRWVAIVTTLVTLGFYAQFESGLPAYALLFLDVPERTIGVAAAVNCLVIVALQMAVVRFTARRNAASLLVVVGLVWVGCWSVLAVASATSPEVAAVLFVTTYGVFAVGETLFAPVLNPLTAGLAPAGMVGTTLGLVASLQTGVSALGPLLAGVALAAGHPTLFVGVHLAIAVGAVLAALRLRQVLRRPVEQRRLDAVGAPSGHLSGG